ncbi:diacylglycerol kinase [Desulfoplanes formicivorans]|uniref:Diacylglycerol kinase n=1 Tax=Desulfoplanes formicivorans TaxID=1592317 RepID=A0A194ABE9_9BACT|nr:diacylglycerol kinase [Desulfoplanes formicivorans]GAU07492.1 diacylglycerol kinase [Desulfoplanes formicivorans]
MPKPDTKPLLHLVAACRYSWKGLTAAVRHEHAFRQELIVAVIAIPLGIYLGEGMIQKVLLAGSWLLVMIVELLNSALEAVVDLVSPGHNPLAGRAKDLGSAAVLLTIVLAGLSWGMILTEHMG